MICYCAVYPSVSSVIMAVAHIFFGALSRSGSGQRFLALQFRQAPAEEGFVCDDFRSTYRPTDSLSSFSSQILLPRNVPFAIWGLALAMEGAYADWSQFASSGRAISTMYSYAMEPNQSIINRRGTNAAPRLSSTSPTSSPFSSQQLNEPRAQLARSFAPRINKLARIACIVRILASRRRGAPPILRAQRSRSRNSLVPHRSKRYRAFCSLCERPLVGAICSLSHTLDCPLVGRPQFSSFDFFHLLFFPNCCR